MAGQKAHCKLNTANVLSTHMKALLLYYYYYFQQGVLFNMKDFSPLLIACVCCGISLELHPDAPNENKNNASGTGQSWPWTQQLSC